MANFVRRKLLVSGVSIVIILITLGLRHSFRFNPETRLWSDSIKWSDFRGFSPPFTKYDAGISSKLNIFYDSGLNQYRVYATMNQTKSWYKGLKPLTDYSLMHEQYHFNLTEAYARLMNVYIKSNPDKHLGFYQIKMAEIINKLDSMQNEYDTDSNHSLRFDQQAKWQYKIDSLLMKHDSMSGLVFDTYSGASIFYPFQPETQTRMLDDLPVRYYELIKYGVRMSLSIRQDYNDSISFLTKGNIKSFYEETGIEIYSEIKTEKDKVIIEIADSLGHYAYEMWQYNYPNTYIVSVAYKSDSLSRSGYLEIAKSFINSFKIVNTDSIWIKEVENFTLKNLDQSSKFFADNPKTKRYPCIARHPSKRISFLRGPIRTATGDLIVAHDYSERNDTVAFRGLVMLEESKQIFETYGSDNKFFIPYEKLGLNSKVARVGFVLDSDSAKVCPPFFNQLVKIPAKN